MRAGVPILTLVLATIASAHIDSPQRRHTALNRAVEEDWAPEDDVIDDNAPWFAEHPEEDDTYESTIPVVIEDRETELEARAVKQTKAGLAWTNEMAKGLTQFKSKGVFGYAPFPLCFPLFDADGEDRMYTWSEWCPTEAKSAGIRCFPMLWGDKNKDKFKKIAQKGYSTYALGMNEVNIKG